MTTHDDILTQTGIVDSKLAANVDLETANATDLAALAALISAVQARNVTISSNRNDAQIANTEVITLMADCDCDGGGGGGPTVPAWVPLIGTTAPECYADFVAGNYFTDSAEQTGFTSYLANTGFSHTNTPRFGTGLILEGSRTNKAFNSVDYSGWTKGNLTIVADSTTAPDGTTTASKVTENSAANVYHELYKSINFTSGQLLTISRYVKAGTRTKGRIWLVNGGTGFYADFDLSAGTIGTCTDWSDGTSSSRSSRIDALANSWYRVSVTGVCGTKTSAFHDVSPRNAAGAIQYTGDGTSYFYTWGAQGEDGGFPSSYIPTTTATVTRVADEMIRTVVVPTSVTVFLHARTAIANSPDYDVLYHLDGNQNGANYNDVEVYRQSNGHLYVTVTYHSGSLYTKDLGVMANDTEFKIAFTASASGLLVSLNGATYTTTTVSNFPTDLTKERLGGNLDNQRNWYGSLLKHATWFNVSTTGTDLQTLSA